jgi:hypothetical protein
MHSEALKGVDGLVLKGARWDRGTVLVCATHGATEALERPELSPLVQLWENIHGL